MINPKLEVLTPQNSQVIFIDHQPKMAFGVQSIANAVAFSRALGLNKADVLGFSIGGMVAQEIALQAANLVRKLILVGTGPRGGQHERCRYDHIHDGGFSLRPHRRAAGFLAPIVGLTTAADFYGIGVILLAVGSLAATMVRRKRGVQHTA